MLPKRALAGLVGGAPAGVVEFRGNNGFVGVAVEVEPGALLAGVLLEPAPKRLLLGLLRLPKRAPAPD